MSYQWRSRWRGGNQPLQENKQIHIQLRKISRHPSPKLRTRLKSTFRSVIRLIKSQMLLSNTRRIQEKSWRKAWESLQDPVLLLRNQVVARSAKVFRWRQYMSCLQSQPRRSLLVHPCRSVLAPLRAAVNRSSFSSTLKTRMSSVWIRVHWRKEPLMSNALAPSNQLINHIHWTRTCHRQVAREGRSADTLTIQNGTGRRPFTNYPTWTASRETRKTLRIGDRR